MSSPSNPQHEPTMEEILASIRKIISEDQPEPAKATVQAAPEPEQPDVLDLTEEMHERHEEPQPEPAPIAYENDIAFESVEEPHQTEVEPAMDDDDSDLISSSTRNALHQAFEPLDEREPKRVTPPAGGSVEAVFISAVQDAFEPTLQQWVASHSSEIMDRIKPMIRAWMDENLPSLIEGAVQKEITRAVASRRKR